MRHWLVGMFVLVSVATASAQSVSTAQINGTVRDQSGGGLPGVTITATQTDTGITHISGIGSFNSYFKLMRMLMQCS